MVERRNRRKGRMKEIRGGGWRIDYLSWLRRIRFLTTINNCQQIKYDNVQRKIQVFFQGKIFSNGFLQFQECGKKANGKILVKR